jgi:molybdopterin converting factor small subunit
MSKMDEIQSILEIQSSIILKKEIFEQYEKYCRTENNQLTVKCLLLQLGITKPKLLNVFVNGTLVDLNYTLKEDDEIDLIPHIAGGSKLNKIRKRKNKRLVFISRHEPNDGQIALAKQMGYSSIQKIEIQFSDQPMRDLEEAGLLDEDVLAIVAPTHISVQLLNAGYTLVEFINSPVKREKMVFCCAGAYKMTLEGDYIKQEFIACPISVDEQYESSLI